MNNASGNPVNGNSSIAISPAEGRDLGFATPGVILPQSNINNVNCVTNPVSCTGNFDGEIGLNTSLTSPPNPLNSGTVGLQAVATHEIDEILGIGGAGSQLSATGSTTGPVGDLDLFRYNKAGTRSYSNNDPLQPYFSINGGATALSFFNQVPGGSDFGDWQSNPDHTGFGVQVQDAFATGGTNPALGPNEITAFNAIGYDVVPAPLIGHGIPAFLGLGVILFGAKLWGWCNKKGVVGLAPQASVQS